ncbi:hypothetical protein GCM10010517_72350 [Streptosporangium fragile]|uniref:Tryptophan halogenase n=1 Tax=Streptosporangium fragile TaxID=46186 RepID=A0ABP6IR57_9ACTN
MTDSTQQKLRSFTESLSAEERAAVSAWLGGGDGRPAELDALFADGEGGPREAALDPALRPRQDDPSAIRSVGVIGGGTAGYLTALALRAKRPWLDVTLVESSGIPIIGVGEATTPSMLPFLHHYLGIDPADLYEKVLPTWKLGIRFDWGPHPEGFMAPFDWGSNSVGVLGSLATQGDINAFTLQSLFMKADRAPVFPLEGGRHLSLMKQMPFAYHLDNQRFVRYLTDLAAARGIRHVDATVAEVVLGGDDWVDCLRTPDGRELRFDLYVDCTGFRSLLLEKTLGSRFVSYAASLATDTAVTGVVPHGGHIKPYTTATTMDAGWCWNIPTREADHVGYVHSSRFLSLEEATEELRRRYPGVDTFRPVRFRVGRHEEAWRGNVVAIGNSYAFVEPLESSGLMMITLGILSLVSTLPASWADPVPRALVNRALSKKWDEIRWFLSIHYRFNTRRDTPFWREMHTGADVSGLEPLLEVFRAGAPLRFRDSVVRGFLESTAPTFYGLEGVDCLLLGQGYPARLLPMSEPVEAWQARKDAADALVGRGLGTAEALRAFDTDPELNAELLDDPDSWVVRTGTDRLVNADPDAPAAAHREPAA